MGWCIDHTLSEVVREGLDQSSTTSWIGQNCLYNPALRWMQIREIRIEPSAGKRLGRRQIKVSLRWQQPAGGQLIARFPHFRCRYRDLCHFRISTVRQREPEVGVHAESVRQRTCAGIFTFNLCGELRAIDRVTHANPEVARPPCEHSLIVAGSVKLTADAVDTLLNGTPRPVVHEAMN